MRVQPYSTARAAWALYVAGHHQLLAPTPCHGPALPQNAQTLTRPATAVIPLRHVPS